MKSQIFFTLPAIILALVIFIASSFETVPFVDEKILGWDKLLHMSVYFLLTILIQIAIAANKPNWSNKKIAAVSVIMALMYALSDEIHQYFVPGRVCDIWDFAADAMGIALSMIFINITSNFVKSKIKRLEK